MTKTFEIIARIDEVISAPDLPYNEKKNILWELASKLWEEAFPSDMTSTERESQWEKIANECSTVNKASQDRIIEILEWPATGADPKWLAGNK